jgi:hypothetical protein
LVELELVLPPERKAYNGDESLGHKYKQAWGLWGVRDAGIRGKGLKGLIVEHFFQI